MEKTQEEKRRYLEQLLQLKEQIKHAFEEKVMLDFTLKTCPAVLTDWHKMSYPQFKTELDLVLDNQLVSTCAIQDWREYFALMKEKMEKLNLLIEQKQNELN